MAIISSLQSVSRNLAKAEIDGVLYSAITKKGSNDTVPHVQADNAWSTLNPSIGILPAVNAVDINWNDASWASVPEDELPETIQSTSDLLKAIKFTLTQSNKGISIDPVNGIMTIE